VNYPFKSYKFCQERTMEMNNSEIMRIRDKESNQNRLTQIKG